MTFKNRVLKFYAGWDSLIGCVINLRKMSSFKTITEITRKAIYIVTSGLYAVKFYSGIKRGTHCFRPRLSNSR